MQYSKNYNMNLPELADQFNVKQWNDNTEKIDTQMKANADAIGAETSRATQKENSLSSAISTETSRATQKENAINSDLTSEKATTKSHRENKNNPHGVTTTQIGAVPKERKVNNHPLTSDVTVTKGDVGLGNVDNKSFKAMAQALFDMEHPIGKKGRIIQYAWEDEPNTKYNNALIKSTWKPVTEYDGKFFKINSKVDVGTPTPESLPNIKGELGKNLKYNNDDDFSIRTGVFTNTKYLAHAGFEGGNYYRGIFNLDFNANKSSSVYQDGAKVQPDNVSIKVWERTK